MTTYVSINTRFNGSRAILSGPAGGVVGYAMTTYEDQPVIGFDMYQIIQ
jgi:5-oxoprolinase (ATP-hydrolysing)